MKTDLLTMTCYAILMLHVRDTFRPIKMILKNWSYINWSIALQWSMSSSTRGAFITVANQNRHKHKTKMVTHLNHNGNTEMTKTVWHFPIFTKMVTAIFTEYPKMATWEKGRSLTSAAFMGFVRPSCAHAINLPPLALLFNFNGPWLWINNHSIKYR